MNAWGSENSRREGGEEKYWLPSSGTGGDAIWCAARKRYLKWGNPMTPSDLIGLTLVIDDLMGSALMKPGERDRAPPQSVPGFVVRVPSLDMAYLLLAIRAGRKCGP